MLRNTLVRRQVVGYGLHNPMIKYPFLILKAQVLFELADMQYKSGQLKNIELGA